ncbi:hypothetical protein BPOR_0143g00130 [Botrytis porri]|uniref:Uncharacterized protein n=1 Tax=Botrytis porri TaxID=87229 RepID=A0A4Z1KW77_9HELO|nr:hypothetical protein BPOR_0143g00130 [Botrytis porri]
MGFLSENRYTTSRDTKKSEAKQQHPVKYLQQDVSFEALICQGGKSTDQVEYVVVYASETVEIDGDM